MTDSTRALILIVLVLALMLVLAFAGSRLLLRRAIKAVIRIFRENQALDAVHAMTQETLGLKPRGLLEFRALRDYKPMALQLLLRYNVVQMTEDGKLYLSEDALARTNIEGPAQRAL